MCQKRHSRWTIAFAKDSMRKPVRAEAQQEKPLALVESVPIVVGPALAESAPVELAVFR